MKVMWSARLLLFILPLFLCEIVTEASYPGGFMDMTIYDNGNGGSQVPIGLTFNITFDGVVYDRVCVCTFGYITFGGCSSTADGLDSLPYPRILIDSRYQYRYRLAAKPTTVG